MSVSDSGLTSLPTPGIYRDGNQAYEIRNSSRGHWYAMSINPIDGTKTYVAQNVSLDRLTGPSGTGTCAECQLPAWDRGLCGMHLAADAVRRAKAVNIPSLV